ncbi:protein MAINTENANCE OF MERISTEMS-like protein [Cinnamomum micranthum f. kanehirae]|uniref:Protein MAINTENANCE OF MERISTEMS-like protein n=1 Tax=Cinnamomum micranthum f. kanehirae TaxID=337451 RepID=A0A3S3PJS9_9MAGN|nr:protein MAINTENANCE OF MERISTEMS-like protein [Cinnamomum micranthum f. kanehirae]
METLEKHLKVISKKIASNNKKSLDKKMLDLIADFKKLYMLYVCSTLLFPKSCRSFPFNIIFMVDKLEKVNDYAWAIAVHEFLIKTIRQSSRKNTGFINGCVMLLEPWFYEHVNRYKPIRTNSYPRYMRWAKSLKYMQSKSFKAILDNLSYTEVIEEITPTKEEMTLLSPQKVSQETTAMADFIVRRMEERMPDIIGDRENYIMKIKDLELRLTILEEENEQLKSENMELRNRGISVPHSPVDIVDASLRRMDHPSSPNPSMSGCVKTSRAAENISKKNGGRVRKLSQMLQTPYDACTKAILLRTKNKGTCHKRERLVADEIQSKIDISEEEEDAIASFEAKVGKDAEEVGKLKIWRSEIKNLLDEEGWISDKIIDTYAKLVSGRKPTGKLNSLKCYFFTSWFNSCGDVAYVNETVSTHNKVSFLKEQFKQRKIHKWDKADIHSLMTALNKTMEKDCQSFEETHFKNKCSTIRTIRGRSSEPIFARANPLREIFARPNFLSARAIKFLDRNSEDRTESARANPMSARANTSQNSVRSTKGISVLIDFKQRAVRSSEPHVRLSEPDEVKSVRFFSLLHFTSLPPLPYFLSSPLLAAFLFSMAPKKRPHVASSKSASGYDHTRFPSLDKSNLFYAQFEVRNIESEREIAKELHTKRVCHSLVNRNWFPLMKFSTKKIHVDWVRESYCNLEIVNSGKIKSFVRGKWITMTVQDIADFIDIPIVHNSDCPIPDELHAPINYDLVATTICGAEISWPGGLLSHGNLTEEYRFLNRFVCHNLEPRGHTSNVAQGNCYLLYCIGTGKRVNIPQIIFNVIVKTLQAKKNSLLPFGVLVTDFLTFKDIPKRSNEIT